MSNGVTYRAIWGHPQDVCRRHPRDVGRGHSLALHTGPSRTSPVCYIFTSLANQQGMAAEEILRTLAQDVPCHYIEGHLGMSTGCLSGTSLGRNFAKRVFFKLFVILMMIRECSFMTSHFNYFIRFLICQKQNILS